MKITIEAQGQEAEEIIRVLGYRVDKREVKYEKPEEKIAPEEKTDMPCPVEDNPTNNWAPGGGEVEPPIPVEQEEPEEPAIKIEDLRKILVDKSKGGKQKEVAALIKSYGVDSLVHIPPENWPELLKKAEDL